MRIQQLAILVPVLAVLAAANPAAAAEKAADFTLKDIDGHTVQLSKVYAEGPVVVSFWATWCVPCPEEMKHLQRLYEKYTEQGLRVLAPAIDGSKTVSKVRPFVVGRRFTFPVLLDTNNDAKRLYNVAVVPTIFLINRAGEIAYHHVGYRPGDEVALEKEIQKVLGQGCAATVKESPASAAPPGAAPGAGAPASEGSPAPGGAAAPEGAPAPTEPAPETPADPSAPK